MDEKTYAITLADGTALTGLRLNGNNYISDVPYMLQKIQQLLF